MDDASQPNRPRRPRLASRTLWLRLLLIALVGCPVLIMGFYLTIGLSFVVGEEFSPERFERRSFQYLELPIVRWQISPISRDPLSGPVEAYVRANRWVQLSPSDEDSVRWDLVWAESNQSTDRRRGEAEILALYLDAVDSNGERWWLEWSKAHPDSAKLIWPAIAQAARHQFYIVIPDIFRLATTEADLSDLKHRLGDLLADRYTTYAEWHRGSGDFERAEEAYTLALRWCPDHRAALYGRAVCRIALDKEKQAARDFARLNATSPSTPLSDGSS